MQGLGGGLPLAPPRQSPTVTGKTEQEIVEAVK